MRFRTVGATGAWAFGAGQNNYSTKNAAVALDVQTRVLSFLGDCFFDLGAGINWINLLQSKNVTAIQLAVSAVILNTQNVTGILQLSIKLNAARQLSIAYAATTTYSKITSAFSYDLNTLAS